MKLGRALLGGFAAVLPVMILPFSLGSHQAIPADVLFLPLLGWALVERVRFRRPPDRFEALLALYLAVCVLSALFSPQVRTGLVTSLKTAYLVATAWALSRLTRTPERFRAMVTGWSIGACLTILSCLGGLLLYAAGLDHPADNPFLHHQGSLPDWLRPRIQGLFLSPNLLCNYLILSLAVVSVRPWKPLALRSWLVAGIATASLFTFSSGLGGIALLLTYLSSRRRWIVGITIAVALLGIASFSFPAALDGRLEPSHRARAWVSALNLWAADPLTGVGPGQVDVDVCFDAPSGERFVLSDPHNVLLSLGAQSGLPAVLAFTVLVGLALRSAWASDPGRTLAVGVLCAIGYHGLTGSFEEARPFWVALGLLWSIRCGTQEDSG